MSIISVLTATDFKTKFSRGFSYLPVYSSATTYNLGNVAYYTNGLFYSALSNGVINIIPTNTTYWAQIQASIYDYILDTDITNAMSEAVSQFNLGLFDIDSDAINAFMYLSAHYLVVNFNNAGINSVGAFSVNSRTVGSVSESFTIPQWVTQDSILSDYATTAYGQRYLNLIKTRLIGNVTAVCGGTNA